MSKPLRSKAAMTRRTPSGYRTVAGKRAALGPRWESGDDSPHSKAVGPGVPLGAASEYIEDKVVSATALRSSRLWRKWATCLRVLDAPPGPAAVTACASPARRMSELLAETTARGSCKGWVQGDHSSARSESGPNANHPACGASGVHSIPLPEEAGYIASRLRSKRGSALLSTPSQRGESPRRGLVWAP